MKSIFLLIAILAGCLLPIQGALLSKLGASLNHPVQATMVSYIGGLLVCLIILFINRTPYPEIKTLLAIDWHLYLAGFFGALFVSSMIVIMPKIGIANMLAAAIVGQLIASSIIDHFGLLGALRVPVSLARVLGIAFLLAGLYLVQWKTRS